MGVRGLLSYCRSIQTHAVINSSAKRIGIDAFSILYLFKDNQEGLETYLKGLQAAGHTLVVVMDKKASKEKEETVEKRKEARADAKEKGDALLQYKNSEEFKALEPAQQALIEKKIEQTAKKAWCLSSKHTKWFKTLLETLKIERIKAEEEADEVLAAGPYDVVISSDSDLLLLGCKAIWIPRGVALQHNEITQERFLQHMGLNRYQLLELAYLAGCDVQPRSILPFAKALSWMRFYKNLPTIHLRHPKVLTQADLDSFACLLEGVWRPRPPSAAADADADAEPPLIPAQ